MNDSVKLPQFVGKRLKPFLVDLPSTWQLWQHKTLNIHRGVIHWDATASACTLLEIREQVRGVVRDQFRPSWWRGFGFGAIVSLSHMHDSFRQAVDLIDVRNNSRGTWQWVVLHFPTSKAAVGVCTWTEGYLAPVYRDLLTAFGSAGCSCESHQKDADALLKTLLAVHKKLKVARGIAGGVEGLLG